MIALRSTNITLSRCLHIRPKVYASEAEVFRAYFNMRFLQVLCSSLITIIFMNKFDCSGVTQIVVVCVCECSECIAVGLF